MYNGSGLLGRGVPQNPQDPLGFLRVLGPHDQAMLDAVAHETGRQGGNRTSAETVVAKQANPDFSHGARWRCPDGALVRRFAQQQAAHT